jgi:hypothetical protein
VTPEVVVVRDSIDGQERDADFDSAVSSAWVQWRNDGSKLQKSPIDEGFTLW